jgi:dihydrofolate reductase
MPTLMVFDQVTLDGYFTSAHGDMSWAHKSDPEWNEFVAGNASGGGRLVFGRVTYDMMASYWPTPQAARDNPVVAKQMNAMPKIVFSKTLDEVSWSNTTLIKDDPATAMRKLKKEPGENMVILGSGSIVSQLTQAGLVDEYQIIVNPLVLGTGKTLFATVKERVGLKLTKTRAFQNGNVLLCYAPA